MKKKLLNKWVSFIGCPNRIYKVLDEDKKYIFYEEDSGKYYERKEYIEKVYKEPEEDK